MKTCTNCETTKTEEEFNWRNKAKGKRNSWCKECTRGLDKSVWDNNEKRRVDKAVSQKQRNLRNAQYLWDYFSNNPCACGEDDPILLEFDHRDPKTKKFNVCDLARRSASIETLQFEISKCDVLCVKCHRLKTAEQFHWYRDIIKGP